MSSSSIRPLTVALAVATIAATPVRAQQLTAAQTAYNVPRTWGMALAAAALAGLGYAVVALVARFAVPWTRAEA